MQKLIELTWNDHIFFEKTRLSNVELTELMLYLIDWIAITLKLDKIDRINWIIITLKLDQIDRINWISIIFKNDQIDVINWIIITFKMDWINQVLIILKME